MMGGTHIENIANGVGAAADPLRRLKNTELGGIIAFLVEAAVRKVDATPAAPDHHLRAVGEGGGGAGGGSREGGEGEHLRLNVGRSERLPTGKIDRETAVCPFCI